MELTPDHWGSKHSCSLAIPLHDSVSLSLFAWSVDRVCIPLHTLPLFDHWIRKPFYYDGQHSYSVTEPLH